MPPIFAGQDAPLRASSIPLLIRCPHRHMIISLDLVDRRDSATADTGSAVHAAIEAWHNRRKGVEDALEQMRKRLSDFPQADLRDAELSVRPYCLDPRNAPEAVQACEVKVDLLLPAHESDPTGETIRVIGTADQIRETGLWDVKHSEKLRGFELLHEYAHQLAVYAAALRIPVGGVINPRGYRKRDAAKPETSPTGVFQHACWQQQHVDALLLELTREVARIRRGEVAIRPGSHCSYCPATSFFDCVEYKTCQAN